MSVIIKNNNKQILITEGLDGLQLRTLLKEKLNSEFYLVYNGKVVKENTFVDNGIIHVIPRVFGGKGGFGSMLRAIGAQIEKTTNREACRDLSGRRLRDINEEQRLKNWINQQAERDKEAQIRKRKKLERLCEKPKHEFKDEEYDKERSVLPEMVEDAVLQGLQASSSTKRKSEDQNDVVKKKKKPKLWVDDDIEEDLSSSSDEDQESGSEVAKKSSDKLEVSSSTNEEK